jgi:hypothetical protein
MKQAQFDLELLLSYLDHFCFFERGHAENLRAWLSMYRKTKKSDPFTLSPGETHVWGPFTMTNMGNRRFVVNLEIREL